MRDGIARLLERMGHTVATTENGRTAWLTLYADLPDLIVLDLMMPKMDGVTFLRMLRAHNHWNELPVLVFTGLNHDESLVQNARSLGVVDVIQKGCDSTDLLMDRINMVLCPDANKTTSAPQHAVLC
jgi:CheY-like chemotaxis protein